MVRGVAPHPAATPASLLPDLPAAGVLRRRGGAPVSGAAGSGARRRRGQRRAVARRPPTRRRSRRRRIRRRRRRRLARSLQGTLAAVAWAVRDEAGQTGATLANAANDIGAASGQRRRRGGAREREAAENQARPSRSAARRSRQRSGRAARARGRDRRVPGRHHVARPGHRRRQFNAGSLRARRVRRPRGTDDPGQSVDERMLNWQRLVQRERHARSATSRSS